MQSDNNLITLVVHTDDRALKLKEILEFHGIAVTIEDVTVEDSPLTVNAKKVRIPMSDLALGLKILESGEAKSLPLAVIKMTGMGNTLLIPVDFSPASMKAVKVGFFLAEKFEIEPIILHSYIAPLFNPSEPFGEDLDLDNTSEINAEEAADLRKIAASQLSNFKAKVENACKSGELPSIKFSTTLLEGIPEQVIHEYCRENNPFMVVMATRGIHKKESDLVGSVTAEVIDSCRLPVLTVPEDYAVPTIDKVKRIALFCTFTGFDMIAIRGLMRTFDYPSCNFYLLPVSDRPINNAAKKLDDLAKYFNDTYPTSTFTALHLPKGKFDERIKEVLDDNDIQLTIVPNKKSSAFSRFFRPTLAHRILFDRDIPLVVLPVS